MKIRKYKPSDLKQVARLISNTFKRFNNKEGTKKGVRDYINFYTPTKKNIAQIKKTFDKSIIFYVAISGDKKIIGMIRGDLKHIGNLFINEKYHRKGIATKLLRRFEKEAKKFGGKIIKINASIYSIPFYQKRGYKKIGGICMMGEVKVQKMEKEIK